VGKKKSMSEEPTAEWLNGIGSETPEQRLAFRNWMQRSGEWSLEDKNQEMIKQGWLPLLRGEDKKVH
jgi:hypothetical protein